MCSFKRGNGEYKFIGDSGKIRDLTNLDSFKLFYRLVSASGYARDNHMIYGLFRREFLQTFFYRTMFPLCTRPEMVILAEMALLTRFYTIPDVLFHKYRPKLKRRDTQHKYFIWYMMIMFVRIWTSKRVHAVQKFRVLVFCPILLYETRKFIWKDLRHIKNIFISILSFKMVL